MAEMTQMAALGERPTQTTPDHTQTTPCPDEHLPTVRMIRRAMAKDGMDWRLTQPTKSYCVGMALASGREKCGSTLGLKLREWVQTAPWSAQDDVDDPVCEAETGVYPVVGLPVPDWMSEPVPASPVVPTLVPSSPSPGGSQTGQTSPRTADQDPGLAPVCEQITADQSADHEATGPSGSLGRLRFLPPIASLGLSAVMQVIIVTDLLGTVLADTYGLGGWAFLVSGLFGLAVACALEGSAAYVLDLYKRHLLEQDSTAALRLVLLGYVSLSGAMIHWWTDERGLPWELALILSCLAGSSILLWILGAKWENRVLMRSHGQLDPAMPRLSTAAKVWHPVRWLQTLRLTSWDPVQTTDQARDRHREWSAARSARTNN